MGWHQYDTGAKVLELSRLSMGTIGIVIPPSSRKRPAARKFSDFVDRWAKEY